MEYRETVVYAMDRAADKHCDATGHTIYSYRDGKVVCEACKWQAAVVWDCVRRRFVCK